MQRILLIIFFVLAIMLWANWAYSATTQPTQPADNIRAATTPSAAIEAYARAGTADNTTKQAFVRRMVDFGTPELAETQARDLINAGVHDPLAIGVGAYVSAAKGEIGAAVQQLKMALMASPQETFLLRTGGQLVAWYDSQTDRSRLTPTDVQALEWIRTNAKDRPAFADAYRAATTPQVGPSQPEPQPVVIAPPAPQPPSQTVIVYDQTPAYVSYPSWGYPLYTNPFVCVTPHHQPWRPVRLAPYAPVIRSDSRVNAVQSGRATGSSVRRADAGRENLRAAPTFRGYAPMRSSGSASTYGGGRGGGGTVSQSAGYGPKR